MNASNFWSLDTRLFGDSVPVATPLWLLLLGAHHYLGDMLFGNLSGSTALLWYKIPSLVALITVGFVALKSKYSELKSYEVFAIVLNPLLIHNAAVVGDWVVFKVLLILALIYAFHRAHFLLAGILTGALAAFSGLIVLIVPWLVAVILKHRQKRTAFLSEYLISAVLTFLMLYLPFFSGRWEDVLFYFNIFESVHFSSNEFNLFAALGLNLKPVENVFVPWFFASLILGALAFLWVKKSPQKQYDTDAFGLVSVLAVALFIPGMPPQSSVAALPFLYVLSVRQPGNSHRFFAQFILLSLILLIEQIYIFDGTRFADNFWRFYKTVPLQWRSPTVTFCFVAKLIVLMTAVRFVWIADKKEKVAKIKTTNFRWPTAALGSTSPSRNFLGLSAFVPKFSFNKFDVTAGFALLLCALGLNFYHLGSSKWFPSKHLGSSTTKITIKKPQPIHGLWLLRNHEQTSYLVTCENNSKLQQISPPRNSSYTWNYHKFISPCERSFELTIKGHDKGVTYEILLSSIDRGILPSEDFCIQSSTGECVDPTTSKLFDEPSTIVPTSFDAGYYDEFFNVAPGIVLVEEGVIQQFGTAHPYLGRFIVAKSMEILGVNPFGWRFPAAFFGALLPLLVFFLARELFASRSIAYGSGVLFLLDSQRIGISRVANVDTQLVCWITLGFIFIVRFVRANAKETDTQVDRPDRGYRGWLNLAFASIFLGAATATKWIGIFAFFGAFSAVLVFAYLRLLQKNVDPESGAIRWIPEKALRFLGIVAGGIFASVAMILTIYITTYLPLIEVKSFAETLTNIIAHQRNMLAIHVSAVSFHPYTSNFLSWPFIDMPMGMHLQKGLAPGLNQMIFLMGNPVVYWSLIPAFFFLLTDRASLRSMPVLLLLVAISSQLMPWIFVQRNLFNYHFLSTSVFGTIALVYVIFNFPFTRRTRIIFFSAATLCLVIYWPVIAGVTISDTYLRYISLFSNWFVPFNWAVDFI